MNRKQERTPVQAIEAALTEKLTWKDGSPVKLRLLPAITKHQLAQFEQSLGNAVSADIRDLLFLAAGFEFPPVGTVNFLGIDLSVETFFRSVPILGDEYGNFWVVDTEPGNGDWGAVFFWCHDPAVGVIQAPTLSAFLEQIFDIGRPDHRDALASIRERCHRIWADDPYLASVAEARNADDPTLSTFARSLPDSFDVADLRKD